MTLGDVGRGALLTAALLTPSIALTEAAQHGLPDYRSVRGRVAVFGNFFLSRVDRHGPDQELQTAFQRFGVRKIADIHDLSPWYYVNRGIIVDGQSLGWWKSPTFGEFLSSGGLTTAVEAYVKRGGFRAVQACQGSTAPSYG